MGFGSYDESEQQDQTVDEEEDNEAVNTNGARHRGEMSVETPDAESMLDQFTSDVKDQEESEESSPLMVECDGCKKEVPMEDVTKDNSKGDQTWFYCPDCDDRANGNGPSYDHSMNG